MVVLHLHARAARRHLRRGGGDIIPHRRHGNVWHPSRHIHHRSRLAVAALPLPPLQHGRRLAALLCGDVGTLLLLLLLCDGVATNERDLEACRQVSSGVGR